MIEKELKKIGFRGQDDGSYITYSPFGKASGFNDPKWRMWYNGVVEKIESLELAANCFIEIFSYSNDGCVEIVIQED